MIATLLGWTKLPQWALELAVIAALAIGFGLYHHHVLKEGIQAQQEADREASAKVEAKAAAATKAAQEAANRAQESYRAEVTRNAALAALPLPAVRLCDDTDNRRPGLPEAGAPHSGDASTSPGAGRVRQVPAGDSGLRAAEHPDIAGLLGLLAQRADAGSAVIREFQTRVQP